jgi:dUTP pyrophosphatase
MYPQNFEQHSVIEVKKLFDNAVIPTRGSRLAAGLDLYAHSYALIKDGKPQETLTLGVLSIPANSRCLIKTGISVCIPPNCYGRVAPRSSLAMKGIDVAAGVVDEDYRGEVGVILVNQNSEPYIVIKGDRIAQLICERIVYVQPKLVEIISTTRRGENGFGSTGQ